MQENEQVSPDALTEDQIIALAQAHEAAARAHMAEGHAKSDEMWGLYDRAPYGDEDGDRSDYVSGDVAGMVQWTQTDLIRLFMSGGKVADFEAEVAGDEAEQKAKQEEEYVNAIFLRDNDGFLNLRNYLLNGLVGVRGYLATYWEGPKPGDPVKVTGVTEEMLGDYVNNPRIKIDTDGLIEGNPEDGTARLIKAEDGTLSFTYRPINFDGAIKVEAPHPKNVLVSKGFETEDDADYTAILHQVNRSDLIRMFPDKRLLIDELGDDDSDAGHQVNERDHITGDSSSIEHGTEPLWLIDEYIRLDMDGDGINELVNIKRVNETILSMDEVDMQPLSSWSSRPKPDEYFASSLAETGKPSQRLRTTLMRSASDGVRQSSDPRLMVNGNKVNMNDVMNPDIGAMIELTEDGSPRDAIAPLIVPDMSGGALQLSEFEEREREFVSGINRQSTGLDPDSLTDTFGGMQLLQNSASAIKELIAREAARGIEGCVGKIGMLLRRHHNYEREMKTKTGWHAFAPMSWIDKTAITVDVGVGTGSREAAMGRLEVIGGIQEKILEAQIDGLVEPQNIYNLAAKMVEAIGFSSPDDFFIDPSKAPPKPPEQPEPDPALIKAQADIQNSQDRLQLDQQKQQHDMAMDRQKVQNDAALAQQKAAFEAQLAQQKTDAEIRLRAVTTQPVNITQNRPGGHLAQ